MANRGDLIETFKIMTGREAVDRDELFQLSACEYIFREHIMNLIKQRASLDAQKFVFIQRVVWSVTSVVQQ